MQASFDVRAVAILPNAKNGEGKVFDSVLTAISNAETQITEIEAALLFTRADIENETQSNALERRITFEGKRPRGKDGKLSRSAEKTINTLQNARGAITVMRAARTYLYILNQDFGNKCPELLQLFKEGGAKYPAWTAAVAMLKTDPLEAEKMFKAVHSDYIKMKNGIKVMVEAENFLGTLVRDHGKRLPALVGQFKEGGAKYPAWTAAVAMLKTDPDKAGGMFRDILADYKAVLEYAQKPFVLSDEMKKELIAGRTFEIHFSNPKQGREISIPLGNFPKDKILQDPEAFYRKIEAYVEKQRYEFYLHDGANPSGSG